MEQQVTIRPETAADYDAIDALVRGSFSQGTDYSDGTPEVALIKEIRGSAFYIPQLSFVAERDGQIVGHVMFSLFPLAPKPEGLGAQAASAAADGGVVMMAPVAVHPDFFGQGVGTAMIEQGLELVRLAGYKAVIVEGNYKYYNRFGFATSADFDVHATAGLPLEEPRYQMAMELEPGALAGGPRYVVYDMYGSV